jgi:hypothetical protein
MTTGFPYKDGESYLIATVYSATESNLKVLYTFEGETGFNGYATQTLAGSPLSYDLNPDNAVLTAVGASWNADTKEWYQPFSGAIAEILVYDLTSTELTDPNNLFVDVRNYIAEKYGIVTAFGGGGDVEPDPVIVAELGAYWTFDETGGMVLSDITANANNGVLENGFSFNDSKTEDRLGNPAGALFFDGVDDRVRVEHSSSIDCYPGVTIAAWIKTTVPQTNAWATLVSKDKHLGGGLFNGYQIGTFADGGLKVGSWMANSNGTYDGCLGTAGAIKNEWQHVAVTHTGSRITVYLNGVEDATIPTTYGLVSTAPQYLYIGANTYFGRPWKGAVDEVAIWKGALTAGNIYYVYLNGVPYQTCQTNGVYFPADINHDCYVDLADFARLAGDWLKCNDPERPECTDVVPQ